MTGPLSTGLRGHRYLLIMTHRLRRGEESILIPWVVPIKLKSDAPKDILKVIDMLPNVGALRGMRGIQIVR
eukprot:12921418-Prorocentrum_lima.AAC.1